MIPKSFDGGAGGLLAPLAPVLDPDAPAGISGGGCACVGTDGEVGETCEFFSLPGPTLPGRTSCAPVSPRSALSGVAPPGAVCANNGAANSTAKAVVSSSFFIGNPFCLYVTETRLRVGVFHFLAVVTGSCARFAALNREASGEKIRIALHSFFVVGGIG